MRSLVAAVAVCLGAVGFAHGGQASAAGGAKTSKKKAAGRGPSMRSLSSPGALYIPKHRRDGKQIRKLLTEDFAALSPHLVEVVRDCPKARDLVRLTDKTSPWIKPSRNHAGPHLIRKSLYDRLVFAGSFAHQRGGYKISVAIGRRSLQDQATLWNWRLLEKFRALKKRFPKKDSKTLARMARPAGEVANPKAYGCGSPHITGGAVDVVLTDRHGKVLVGFARKFYYGNFKQYRQRFLLSKKKDAVHARLLEEIMHAAGFVRYCREAWHFEAGPTTLYKTWKRAGRPGRCFGAGKGGSWDPRREPDADHIADLLGGLPRG